jgi:hypothetical protein
MEILQREVEACSSFPPGSEKRSEKIALQKTSPLGKSKSMRILPMIIFP